MIEQVLRHERVTLAVLLALPAACWAWVVVMARDMYGPMTGASAWMMTLRWDAAHVLLLWAMWSVMMVGMMLPSAAPAILLFAGAARRRGGNATARIYSLTAGYLTVWIAFSTAATILQRWLAATFILSPMMELSTPAGGVVLVIAGVYQVTPLKRVCLTACQSPLSFLMQRWREGVIGAFRMGLSHGLYCVGCCWALMLLLFAGGVMNLAVIVGLTVFVAVEKLGLLGRWGPRVTGSVLIAGGLWMVGSAA